MGIKTERKGRGGEKEGIEKGRKGGGGDEAGVGGEDTAGPSGRGGKVELQLSCQGLDGNQPHHQLRRKEAGDGG